eukprot:CAMPEP_0116061536 /NCGR_PEP_ID=MMETSP0322-20121206/7148_1 /TAXON_ID=163516 /ORGANISM="Leptocylindrus danicus var. apora, Strain B651" /LENGTH=31 /DNA_ID= /DNA_START= /DNA_END= /DNA_ORIENTATION=
MTDYKPINSIRAVGLKRTKERIRIVTSCKMP